MESIEKAMAFLAFDEEDKSVELLFSEVELSCVEFAVDIILLIFLLLLICSTFKETDVDFVYSIFLTC